MNQQTLGTPALDPAYVIGWHVGKAAADRAARECEVAVSEKLERRAAEPQGRMAA